MNLTNLNNLDLVSKTKNLVSEERKLTTEILVHLREIEKRRIHLYFGYSSLHEFCVKHLGYSDGSAHRRISAMRLIKEIPEIAKDCHTAVGKAKYGKFGDNDGREEQRLKLWRSDWNVVEPEAYKGKYLEQLKAVEKEIIKRKEAKKE